MSQPNDDPQRIDKPSDLADAKLAMYEHPVSAADDPLISLRGMWKGLWKDETPDDYVRRLRHG